MSGCDDAGRSWVGTAWERRYKGRTIRVVVNYELGPDVQVRTGDGLRWVSKATLARLYAAADAG